MVADSYTTATGEVKADSTSRRNSATVSGLEVPVKRLRGCLPAERLARSGVEGLGNSRKGVDAVHAEIGPVGKILPKRSVSIFGGSSLPWTLRITEADLYAGINLQSGMLCHLSSLIQVSERRSCSGKVAMVRATARRSSSVMNRLAPANHDLR